MFGQSAAPKNLCVLRLSALEDVCHTIAVVQNIQQHWPHTQFTWVCGKKEAELLKGLNRVDIIVFDQSAGLKGYSALRRKMKGHSFQLLLQMQTGLQANLVSYFIPAKTKIGVNKLRDSEGKRLLINNKQHKLDEFMEFSNNLVIKAGQPQWNMPLSDNDEQWVVHTLGQYIPVAVICPAASNSKQSWHIDGYARTAEYLEKKGFKVVLCGGTTARETELADDIYKKTHADVINLVGKTSLKQLLGILKLAHVVIAPNSYTAHMSVTVGTPVIGLYAYNNPLRTGPYLYQKYVASCYHTIIEQQYSKPITQLPLSARPKGKDLMKGITVELVQEKVDLVINDFYPELLPTNRVV